MWIFEKKMEFPIKIKNKNPDLARLIITQYGGSDGELGAALRYISQRYTMVTPQAKALLNDIGTEELGHLEMIGAIVYQLSEDATEQEIKASGFDSYFVDHGLGVYPCSAGGVPFTAASIASKGDPITDLYEDMAAEQKARTTYENLMKLTDDPDVLEPLRFLREREVVHFQRFGEGKRIVSSKFESCGKPTSKAL
jgi:spore coat protein JC